MYQRITPGIEGNLMEVSTKVAVYGCECWCIQIVFYSFIIWGTHDVLSAQAVEDMMWKISRLQHLKRIKIRSYKHSANLLTCCLASLQELTGPVQLELNFTSDTLDLEKINLPKRASCIIHCKEILGAPSCLPHFRVKIELPSRSGYAVGEYGPHMILTIKPKYCLN